MAQKDRYKNRFVNIDYIVNNDLDIQNEDGYWLTLVSTGSFEAVLNGVIRKVDSPSLMCLTQQDTLQITKKTKVVATTIKFDNEFLCTLRVSEKKYLESNKPSIKAGMQLFKKRTTNCGIYQINTKIYPKILEKFLIAGGEIQVQSDEFWVCRIKKNLIELLSLVDELEKNQEKSPLNLALNYIHANYAEKITLDKLLQVSLLNRDSLNKIFRKNFKCTALQYLQQYRIKIAKELLTHTGLSLNEIAIATGFSYDTYFIKKFEKLVRQKPTDFRRKTRKLAAYQ